MDHPLRLERADLAVKPWRLATLAIAAVAVVELVLLVVAGSALLSRDDAVSASPAKAKPSPVAATVPAKKPVARTARKPTAVGELSRRQVKVVVLNGNGRSGAAAAAATRVSRRGYRIGLVGNAGSHDYPRSIVMYRRGFAAEGQRLAQDLGVPIVSPLDGMRPGQLHGAHAVLILGA